MWRGWLFSRLRSKNMSYSTRKLALLQISALLILCAVNALAQLPKSPIDSYNSDCNNYLTFKDLEKPLNYGKNIQRQKQELEMGEVLVKDKVAAVKAEAKEELFSDKFKGGTQIHEIFAYHLAKATDGMLDDFNNQTPAQRRYYNELSDALQNHAEYEIEGDGHALIGPKNSTVISQVIEKFGLEKAKPMVAGVIDKGVNSENGEAIGLKKHGVFEEFSKIAQKAVNDAMDDYSEAKGKEPEVALNTVQAGVPANQVDSTTVSTKEVLTSK